MSKEYDLVVLGGGTGGYVGAIHAAQAGMSVAIVEREKLGGTCLHKGCIPSKTLLKSAEVFQQTKYAFRFGVQTNAPVLDVEQMQKNKQETVDQLYRGVESLVAANQIDLYKGFGRILGPSIFSPMPGTISVESDGENAILNPKNLLIATGSHAVNIPGLEADGLQIWNSDHALEMTEIPSSIIIIGGGVIGVEWASMLADFGTDVTVVEASDQILPAFDESIAKEAVKLLSKKGIRFITGATVATDSVEKKENTISVVYGKEGKQESIRAEKILTAVGRKGNTADIGLENTAIDLENGHIKTNGYYQTEESHMYAIGDVIGGMQLAHAATQEAIIAVDHMTGENPLPLEYRNVPSCVYSSPEIASVGLSEQQAKTEGIDYDVNRFPYKAIGKALVHHAEEGFIKIITDKTSKDLLGVHLIGIHATELISEAVLATFLDANLWELANTPHAHPSLSEIFKEAALKAEGIPIHSS